MLELLRVVVPIGLSAAVSPVVLSEQAAVVGGPRGRRTGLLFTLGTVVVLVLVAVGGWFLGQSLQLPALPDLDARADVAFGVVLLLLAVVLAAYRPRHREAGPRPRGPMSPAVALGFGVFSMATNFTTLPLVLVAVKDVTAADQSGAGSAFALGLLVVLASAPAWLPLLLAAVPGRGLAVLTALSDVVSRHGRQVASALLLLVGAWLVVRGVVHLVGG